MKITKAQLIQLEQSLIMRTKDSKPPTLAQFLSEHQSLFRQAKKNGYSLEDIVSFFDTQNIPCTTKMIEKAWGRGLTKEVRSLAKQIILSQKQYSELVEAFSYWSSQSNLVTKLDVVRSLFSVIQSALEKGYDFEDMAAILSIDCKISGRTLKSLYKQVQQEKTTQLPIPLDETTSDQSIVNPQKIGEKNTEAENVSETLSDETSAIKPVSHIAGGMASEDTSSLPENLTQEEDLENLEEQTTVIPLNQKRKKQQGGKSRTPDSSPNHSKPKVSRLSS